VVLKKRLQNTIEKATVTILKTGGRGVLINGKLIITAAHCVTYKVSGEMALGEYFIEEIETVQGKRLKVSPLAVEPVSDIAVLGSLDDQALPTESDEFGKFCEKTKPTPVYIGEHELHQKFPIYVFNNNRTWSTGTAEQGFLDQPTLFIETKEPIEGGASGGPIVNDLGELVGIVSHFSIPIGNEKCNGFAPRPHLALPVWLYHKIIGQNWKDV